MTMLLRTIAGLAGFGLANCGVLVWASDPWAIVRLTACVTLLAAAVWLAGIAMGKWATDPDRKG